MPNKIQLMEISSGVADAFGDATATSTLSLTGKVLAIYLEYDASSAAGTDVAIDSAGDCGGAQNILDIDDANTSGWFYPRTPMEDYQGTDVTYDNTNEIYTEFVVYDRITITITGQTEDKAVKAYILYEEY